MSIVLFVLAGCAAVLAAIGLNGCIGPVSWWSVLLIVVVFLPAVFFRLLQNARVPA